jgi:glycosyltransferase involved in cell wall biosynthesis
MSTCSFSLACNPKKGLEVLIDAFASLMANGRFARWKLLIAGDGEPQYVESLKSLVRKSGIESSVVFTGWLDGEQKSAALHGASLLALPSYQENFGNCVMEALACGVPVLVSPHVNLASEVERDGAGWIVPVEKNAIAACLDDVFSSEVERTKRALAGKRLSNRFSWPVIGDQLHVLYSSLCCQS